MVKKLEWIEMAQLATILFSEGPAEMPVGGSMKMQGRQVIESPSAPILRTAWSLGNASKSLGATLEQLC
jgi:hypothetical protein